MENQDVLLAENSPLEALAPELSGPDATRQESPDTAAT